MEHNVKSIFWTGGWDSTFRIIQLSRGKGVIQPVYICGDNRKSESREIESMNKILALLRENPHTTAELLPIKIIHKGNIPENESITIAYKKLCEITKIGTQYEYLARYAALYPKIELGAESPDGEFSGIVEAIERFGNLIAFEDSWILARENTMEECMLVFGNFSLPIIKTKEREMLDIIREWGYEDVMKNIWFCHNPIHDEPCGFCRPCEQKMEEHMEWLLPEASQKRYRRYKKLSKIFRKKARNMMRIIYH